MVYKTYTLVMKPRNYTTTKQALKEFAVTILNSNGVIRKLSNEGIMRPYTKFKDVNQKVSLYARYVVISCDIGLGGHEKFSRHLKDHPDVMHFEADETEADSLLAKTAEFFPLDLFSRSEEEINWPPQTSADIHEQLEMNWKEFSRTRWSDYLRQ